MAKSIFRKFLLPLVASAALASLPNPGFAQRGGGSRGGGGGPHGGGFAGGFRGGALPGGSIRGGGGFGPGAFSGVGLGVSGGRYGRSGAYSGAYQNRMFGSARGSGTTGSSRMSRGAPNASGPRSFATADGQWHSFSASRGGSAGHGSGNGTVSPRSSSGESEWRYFGNHSGSSSPSSRGSTAAHQPSSNPSGTSANVAATGSALKTVTHSGSSGFGVNSVLGSWRFGSNLMASNLRSFSSLHTDRLGFNNRPGVGLGVRTFGRPINSGFGFSGFNRFGFKHFGFGCFGCGFSFSSGVGFGFGWPWGWGSWWGPGWGWGWNVGYYPPPAIVYSRPHDQPSNNSPSDSPAPSNRPTNPPSPSKLPASPPSVSEIAQRSEPTTNNGENAAIRLYLKDGGEYSVQDCWMAYGKVHYTLSDGDESAVDINQLDLQRTLDENSQHLCTVHETEPINPMLSTERK
jgi:hypothetical protein